MLTSGDLLIFFLGFGFWFEKLEEDYRNYCGDDVYLGFCEVRFKDLMKMMVEGR